MKLKADIELKLRRFIKKYNKLIIFVIIIILIIFAINKILANKIDEPKTTYNPDVSVLDSSSKVPTKVKNAFEEFIANYVEACNKKDYETAWNMISSDCQTEYFGSISSFKSYVDNNYSTKRCYAIQDYSNYNDKYIYSVKLHDDFLSTGLTDSSYRYLEEKMTVSYDEQKNIVFSVANFIEKDSLQSVQENEYLKSDVKYRIVKYSYEEYVVKLTNRSNYTIVIQGDNLDGTANEYDTSNEANGENNTVESTINDNDEGEIMINLGQETRINQDTNDIILNPGEAITIKPVFNKFCDDGDITKSLILNSVRVYDGTNLVDKLSMTMGF